MADSKEYYVEPDMKRAGITGRHQIFRQTAEARSVSAKAHIHSGIELIYVEEGSFTAWLGEKKYLLSTGDLLLIRSGEIHRICAGEEKSNAYCVIKIDPSLLFSFADEANAARYVLNFKLGKERRSLWKKDELDASGIKNVLDVLIKEKFTPEFASDIAVRCKCAELMLLLLRECGAGDDSGGGATDTTAALIYKAIEYISERYQEDISARDCSKNIGLSYSYFSRTFKAVTGRTFSEYLSDVRLNRAKKLLLTTDKQVSEIAYECGFSDPCYFISSFRSRSGITPKQYRQKTTQGTNR